MSLLHYHPFKGLYLAVELAFTLFVRVPVWVALSLPRSWRPRPSWSIKRVLHLKLFKTGIKVLGRTGPLVDTPSHLAIAPGVDVNGVWVDPVPHLITSPLTEWSRAAGVDPIKIPGYWIHKQGATIPVGAPPMPGEKVLYSMHGGAYTRLSAHPSNLIAAVSKGILKHTDSIHRVFAIEYRLSSESFAPFPAALLDALAGYNYLVNQVGIHPADIVFEGDSAGANLAHALTRYLIEHQNDANVQLPAPPGSLLLLSPWVDLSSSHDRNPATDSSSRFADSDYLDVRPGKNNITWSKDVFIGPHGYGAAETNRYISPAAKNPMIFDSDSRKGTSLFKGFPRTFIVVGGAEALYDQIKTFIDRMVSELGHGDGVKDGEGKVAWYEAPDAVHDFLIFAWHEPERTDTLKAIAAWIDKA
ncbi:hypothetical protein CCMSSC00406_0002362 [Pleurotus cornucopiae]|uniref:Uncharacterized protein n=1 Tax=Pleurotus cornucopiae TaxID=5321 RepID=A0ACB7IU44_PLECO|nr:hypothetical protein CCMSSC00406_0002362 [Pleurotus cornucopiae]